MKTLAIKAIARIIILSLGLALLILLPAGTLHYWQALLFLPIFALSVSAPTFFLLKYNPALLEKRMKSGQKTEKQGKQKILHFLLSKGLLLSTLLAALDHRYQWSEVPGPVVIAGDLFVALGFLIVLLVFRENTFASANVEVVDGQKVISTGPYAVVRHPMYSGCLLTILGVPLALGSWWGVSGVILTTIVIVWRLLEEESFLQKSLPGYAAYLNVLKYRLIPFIW